MSWRLIAKVETDWKPTPPSTQPLFPRTLVSRSDAHGAVASKNAPCLLAEAVRNRLEELHDLASAYAHVVGHIYAATLTIAGYCRNHRLAWIPSRSMKPALKPALRRIGSTRFSAVLELIRAPSHEWWVMTNAEDFGLANAGRFCIDSSESRKILADSLSARGVGSVRNECLKYGAGLIAHLARIVAEVESGDDRDALYDSFEHLGSFTPAWNDNDLPDLMVMLALQSAAGQLLACVVGFASTAALDWRPEIREPISRMAARVQQLTSLADMRGEELEHFYEVEQER